MNADVISSYISLLLLRADDPKEMLRREMEKYGIFLGDGCFSLLAVRPREVPPRYLLNETGFCLKQLRVILEDILYGNEIYYLTAVGDSCMALICYPHLENAQDPEVTAHLGTYAQQLLETCVSWFGSGSVSVYAAPVTGGVQNIPKLMTGYRELYEYFQFLEKIPEIFLGESWLPAEPEEAEQKSQYSDMRSASQFAQELLYALQEGKTERYDALLERLFRDMLLKDSRTLKMVHYRLLTFIDQLLLKLNDTALLSRHMITGSGIYQEVTEAATVTALRSVLRGFIDGIHTEIQKTNRQILSRKSAQADRVRHYIDANISDAGLDVNRLAEIFGISQALLSSSFKRNGGIAPSDYIRMKRVGLAKEYLRETDKSVMEICALSGFGSVTAMHRTFRQLTGSTPARYREQCRQQRQGE